MAKFFAILRGDGGVSIMTMPDNGDVGLEIAKQKTTMREGYVSHVEIPGNQIPTDRTFRAAWKVTGSVVSVDMPKARAIHMDRIRSARKPKLEALDIEFTRALGKKNQKLADEVEAKRETVRTVDETYKPAIEAATTPEQLKAIWPEELL